MMKYELDVRCQVRATVGDHWDWPGLRERETFFGDSGLPVWGGNPAFLAELTAKGKRAVYRLLRISRSLAYGVRFICRITA